VTTVNQQPQVQTSPIGSGDAEPAPEPVGFLIARWVTHMIQYEPVTQLGDPLDVAMGLADILRDEGRQELEQYKVFPLDAEQMAMLARGETLHLIPTDGADGPAWLAAWSAGRSAGGPPWAVASDGQPWPVLAMARVQGQADEFVVLARRPEEASAPFVTLAAFPDPNGDGWRFRDGEYDLDAAEAMRSLAERAKLGEGR
jgi:hypothetical protein